MLLKVWALLLAVVLWTKEKRKLPHEAFSFLEVVAASPFPHFAGIVSRVTGRLPEPRRRIHAVNRVAIPRSDRRPVVGVIHRQLFSEHFVEMAHAGKLLPARGWPS
jgi:hypothetical protein